MPIGLAPRAGALVRAGAAGAVLAYLGFRPWNLTDQFFVGAPLGRDFVNFWLGPHLAWEGRAPLLVDVRGYGDLVAGLFGHRDDLLLFSYPPLTILLLLPFGLAPFLPALAVWTLLNLAALAAAARALGASRGLAAVAALSPAAAIAAIYGHFSGGLALAATLALREAERRPALAGALLALAAAKIQFAVMLGIVLLLAGRWRCLVWAAGFGVALLALSVLALGIAPWQGFVEATLPLHRSLLAAFVPDFFRHTVTLYTGARLAGVPDGPATLLQAAFGACAVAAAALALRRHGPTPGAIAVAILAAILALPYGGSYDLAAAVPAVTVARLGNTQDAPPGFATVVLWLAPVFVMPLALSGLPLLPPLLAGAFVALIVPLIRPERTTARPVFGSLNPIERRARSRCDGTRL